jgi:tetratricopeptide (TPR) repeat protein
LRKAQTLVAIGNYPLAVETFKKALLLHPAWANCGFTLDELYGPDNAFAKKAHREALEEAFAESPGDAALPFLIGMQYLYDGQKEKALEFFTQAKQLGGEGLGPNGIGDNAANNNAAEDNAGDFLPPPPAPAAAPQPMPPPDAD